MLVYISTFVSPHTLPLGVALSPYYSRVVFINTMELTQERRKMGYEVVDQNVEIKNYLDNPQECQRNIEEAEDVILAGTDFDLVSGRIKVGKRVFLNHERIFKKGLIKLLDFRTWKIAKFCISVREKPVYLLAIGENSAKDFCFLGFNRRKIYRFGYFPTINTYPEALLFRDEDVCRILWVGRFVNFKRPVMAVKAVRGLDDGFSLTMAGDGALLAKTETYAKKHGVPVTFLGNIPSAEVERQMLQSHILLSTSHKGEGWGAVINEGMNRGCAVVCAEQIGCAGSLATNNNAVLFRTHSVNSLRRAIKDAANRRQELGMLGYDTIINSFNAEIAAQRFVLLAREGKVPGSGICSKVFR